MSWWFFGSASKIKRGRLRSRHWKKVENDNRCRSHADVPWIVGWDEGLVGLKWIVCKNPQLKHAISIRKTLKMRFLFQTLKCFVPPFLWPRKKNFMKLWLTWLYDFMIFTGGHRCLVAHCCWQELYERHVGQLSQQIRNSQDWKMERKRLWNSIPLGCGKWRFIRVMVCDGGVWHPGEGGASQSILTLFPSFFFVSFHQMILELRAALVELQNRSAPKKPFTVNRWTVSNCQQWEWTFSFTVVSVANHYGDSHGNLKDEEHLIEKKSWKIQGTSRNCFRLACGLLKINKSPKLLVSDQL